MHTLHWVSIRCAISLALALSCLTEVHAADSKIGDTFSETVYLKVRSPEASSRICGLYLSPGSLIAGTALHVFPDGTAMIAEFSDISAPRLIATGNWNYEADILKIIWSHLQQRGIFKSSMVPKQQGDIREYIMYSGTSSDRKTTKYFLVPPDVRPVVGFEMISQLERYHDWQKIKSMYLK